MLTPDNASKETKTLEVNTSYVIAQKIVPVTPKSSNLLLPIFCAISKIAINTRFNVEVIPAYPTSEN